MASCYGYIYIYITPPVQVAEGHAGGAGASIDRRKLERDAATTCNLHMGTNMIHSCALVEFACLQ